jgi:hypothetical protein
VIAGGPRTEEEEYEAVPQAQPSIAGGGD